MVEAIGHRRREREERIETARRYVGQLSHRLPVVAAALVGSVARGDFNVWSDTDVVVVAEALPPRFPDRAAVLAQDAPVGVEPIGFTPGEFWNALARRSPHATEAIDVGIVLQGAEFFTQAPPS